MRISLKMFARLSFLFLTFIIFRRGLIRAEKPTEGDNNSQLVSFFEGESFQLACGNIVGTDDSITWKINGTELVKDDLKGEDSKRIEVKEDWTLSVINATVRDLGEYSCSTSDSTALLAKYRVNIKAKKSKNEMQADEGEKTQVEPDLKVIQAEHAQLKDHVLSRLDSVELASGKSQQKLIARLRELENKLASLEKMINKMESSRNELMMSDEAGGAGNKNVDVAQLRYVDNEFVSENVWIVPNFEKEFEKAKKDESIVFSSPPFYTHKPGYRMELTIYPNYRKTNFTGLFASLIHGEYDDVIPWPYPHDFRLEIVSHRPNIFNDAATIRLSVSNCGTDAFSKPALDQPSPGCGFRQFMSHSKLQKNKKAFLLNGSLIVRIQIFVAN